MYQNIAVLNSGQIVRLYNVIDTKHQIVKALYLGYGAFNVITDRNTSVYNINAKMTMFVLNGILLNREGR